MRGDAILGNKLTAFAKKTKKVQISCAFQWFRVSMDRKVENIIPGADKASYTVVIEDIGFRLKVVGTPLAKDSGEQGALVSAVSDVVPGTRVLQNEDTAENAPVLTDWKVIISLLSVCLS